MPRFRASAAMAAALTASAMVLTATPALAGGGDEPVAPGTTRLTLLHANDLESALLPIELAGAEHAGAARFVQLLRQEQEAATGPLGTDSLLTLHAGDGFLPGPELDAGQAEDAGSLYDATAFAAAGFDVGVLGNHDFDLGPEFLAEYLRLLPDTDFVSANLDLAPEPALAELAGDGTVVARTVVEDGGEQYGVIGLTTPELPQLSSSGDVAVDRDLAGVVNAQAAALEARGVDRIILLSHLQDIGNEIELVADLTGVDLVVGGGGGEIMASPGNPLPPEDEVDTGADGQPLAYPTTAVAADGAEVPVVTTTGLYRYVGKLVVDFDAEGDVVGVDANESRPLPVDSSVEPDPQVLAEVEEPVSAYVAGLADEVVATSEVPLDGTRTAIRGGPTNLGDLVADSLLAAGRAGAADAGIAEPVVALQNGGGIRNDSVLPAGPISALDTFDVTPFPNFVAVAPEMPVADFVAALDHGSVAGEGSFAQIAGFTYTADPAAPAGTRITELTLDDGTALVAGGEVVGEGTISVTSIDFLLRGSDGYAAFEGTEFTVLPQSQQAALQSFLRDDLGGTVTAEAYPAN
ncbi:5'-nucleotidase C-terminal domain-containing protein [Pseudonocardia nematodicida]|uniref:5'-nucleotidase C-terminal domain-containing protein n=1 Tax=Pseudonocardia nematodicida TaxID=1206997 RepID=A0ABV1K674_9PSEU